eukprot:5069877-Karenia_brevis.AAC.1
MQQWIQSDVQSVPEIHRGPISEQQWSVWRDAAVHKTLGITRAHRKLIAEARSLQYIGGIRSVGGNQRTSVLGSCSPCHSVDIGETICRQRNIPYQQTGSATRLLRRGAQIQGT